MGIRSALMVFSLTVVVFTDATAQSPVWIPDMGNGSYKNPVIHADYSDPDVCRVGGDYYLVSSSFNATPGLPILHSKDLVNWKILGHALKRQPPFNHFEKVQHGNGVWAPSIRYHDGEFWIYYPDPDFGIYLIKAKNAEGPWSDPLLVESGRGLIDPCPLWDTDGNNYLVYAYAGSRAGIKSVIAVKRLNTDGTRTIDNGLIVYDGHDLDPTIEGPKFYKRNNYYYIFAPAGGVSTGWQLVLRSKNVYGPYERKVVMGQGSTVVNGPHQGAWVTTEAGEDWFLHFQDKDAYGRVVHLQPMKWINDWPVIGEDNDGDGKGQPVSTYKKPAVSVRTSVQVPATSDEFSSLELGKQWQWQANPQATWQFISPEGYLRLFSAKSPDSVSNYWHLPNILAQKFPADKFTVTTKLKFTPNTKLKETTGLIIIGQSYAFVGLQRDSDGINLVYAQCKNAAKGDRENLVVGERVGDGSIYLRVTVMSGAACRFSYSIDGDKFMEVGEAFDAEPGRWVGAKVGIFCTRDVQINDSGYADFDWFRIHN
jgi:beta-xylosidase